MNRSTLAIKTFPNPLVEYLLNQVVAEVNALVENLGEDIQPYLTCFTATPVQRGGQSGFQLLPATAFYDPPQDHDSVLAAIRRAGYDLIEASQEAPFIVFHVEQSEATEASMRGFRRVECIFIRGMTMDGRKLGCVLELQRDADDNHIHIAHTQMYHLGDVEAMDVTDLLAFFLGVRDKKNGKEV